LEESLKESLKRIPKRIAERIAERIPERRIGMMDGRIRRVTGDGTAEPAVDPWLTLTGHVTQPETQTSHRLPFSPSHCV